MILHRKKNIFENLSLKIENANKIEHFIGVISLSNSNSKAVSLRMTAWRVIKYESFSEIYYFLHQLQQRSTFYINQPFSQSFAPLNEIFFLKKQKNMGKRKKSESWSKYQTSRQGARWKKTFSLLSFTLDTA